MFVPAHVHRASYKDVFEREPTKFDPGKRGPPVQRVWLTCSARGGIRHRSFEHKRIKLPGLPGGSFPGETCGPAASL